MKYSFYLSIYLLFQTWILLLVPSLLNDEHHFTIFGLLLYLNLFFILLIFLIKKIFNLKIDKYIQYFLTSFIILITFIGLVLSNLNFFLYLGPTYKIIVILVSLIFIFFITHLIYELKLPFYFLIIFIIFQVSTIIFNNLNNQQNNENYLLNYNLNIQFKNKPNIFIFSFDGLAPYSIVKKDYNLDIQQEINSNKLEILTNTFNENIYTKSALNTLFFLSPEIWRNKINHNGPQGQNSYFSGISKSPLYTLLKNNGYNIGSGYLPGAWSLQGKYIDEYNLNKHSENIFPMFCRWPLPSYYFQLFNFCKVHEYITQKLNEDYKDFIFKEIKNIRDIEDKKFYLSAIKSLEKKISDDKPWFFIQHIYRPGHTNDNYIHNDQNFKKFSLYYRDRTYEVVEMINMIIKNLEGSNSILIIMGDHGPLLFGQTNLDTSETKEKIKLKIIDKHAAFLAYFDPQEYCKNDVVYLEKNKLYKTPTMLVNRIFNCLSEQEHLKNKTNYSLPYEGLKFEDFIYE